jgi:hypothetical protein
MRFSSLLVSTLILAQAAAAQISYHTAGAQFKKCDYQTNVQTILTGIPAAVTGLNCIHMTSPVTGFIGTVTAPTNIYSFTLAGNVVTLGNSGNPLNTSATVGGNIAELAEHGGYLYFTTQGGTGGGALQRMKMTGGGDPGQRQGR